MGTSFNPRACPTKRCRLAVSLRNFFLNLMATVDAAKRCLAIVSPRKSQMLPHGVQVAKDNAAILPLLRRNAAARRLSWRT
ncbi:MAG: hypothetical protein ACYDD8_12380 [Bradyrhizobium sp.]